MLKNHLLIALRGLRRRPGYAAINVVGLAVGLACCILILLFVHDEWRVDRFHADADRIVRITTDATIPGAPPDAFALTSRRVARAVASDMPEAEAVAYFEPWEPTVRQGGRYYTGDAVFFAAPGFFEVFPAFGMAEGDPALFERPYTLVLTPDAREKYFGDGAAVGETLVVNDSLTFTVAGVLGRGTDASHLQFDWLASQATLEALVPDVWESGGWLDLTGWAYVKLAEGADADAFAAKVAPLITDAIGEELEQYNISARVTTEPLTGVYLHSGRDAQIGPTGNARYVYAFAAIALFVLVIAAVNFVNLATARSVERAKEVGVRKVVGSTRGLLVRQFLVESVLVAGVALGLALGIVSAALPWFNDLAEKELALGTLLHPAALAACLGLALVVGLLAGSYPAFALARFRPVEVLKGTFRTGRQGVRLRQGLVVFQFAVSVALIAGTAIVVQQLRYMQAQDLGFEEEQMLVVDLSGLPNRLVGQTLEAAEARFAEHAAVAAVTSSNNVPGRGAWVQILRPEGLPEGDSRRFQVLAANHDYLGAYGIDLVAGRALARAFETDAEEAVVVNEAAAANSGWTPEEALGKSITFGNGSERRIVGVYEDYHHFGLTQAIEPQLIRVADGGTMDYVSVRVSAADAEAVQAHLEAAFRELYPGYTYDAFFLDDDFDRQYRTEARLARIFVVFAGLAILIACLGLFGLASFVVAGRTKEIGVRKVLGASVPGIVGLLSKEFLVLVLVAVALAAPVAWWAMSTWLEAFPYRVAVGPLAFVLAGGLALGIAALTVSAQAIRAATADPVESLRYE